MPHVALQLAQFVQVDQRSELEQHLVNGVVAVVVATAVFVTEVD